MSLLIQYLVKLSISLAIVWLFYQFVLRKLTFYNPSRWYLIGYTLLSFLIPFINISPVLESNKAATSEFVQLIPSVHQYTVALEEAAHCPVPIWSTHYDKWDWMAFGLMAGAGIFFLRFIFRCISFFRMRRKAKLISADGMKLYEVNENIIPFSFGNAVFVNSKLHTESELQEIIRHEFVHVKQRHTFDIIWSEWLCIINWYNPFAWLLKRSIRQNLEFIADNKVLENGINKKQYQYLLLKVIGNNQFSIAPKFNFSSLKKRIAMMNKLKTARLHLVRFLFILPVLAVILLSFRKQTGDSIKQDKNKETAIVISGDFTDTVPDVMELNDKGYYIDIKGKDGDCIVVVKDKNRKEVERVLLTKWKENQKYYENLYGEILPPPPPVPPVPPTPPIASVPPADEDNPGLKAFLEKNPDVKSIGWVYNNVRENVVVEAQIFKKDGTTEVYDLKNDADKAKVEKKYGELPLLPSLPPLPPIPLVLPKMPDFVNPINKNVSNEPITVAGYPINKNVSNEPITVAGYPINKNVSNEPVTVAGYPINKNVSNEPITVAGYPVNKNVSNEPITVAGYPVNKNVSDEDILVTITKKTTQQQLDGFVKQMKEKDIELKFDHIDYKNGILVSISGTMKYKNGQGSFSETGFNKLIISGIKDGDRFHLKIDTRVNKTVS